MTEPLKEYQLEDMKARSSDKYALAKYEILLGWLGRGAERLRVLVAGCGSGELAHLLAARGHEVTGFDPGESYVRMAAQRAEEMNLRGCRFEVSTIEAYQPQQSFDVIFATDVIEHIRDDRYAVERLVSWLTPQGRLVVTVPAGQWLFGYHDQMLEHFRRYSVGGLRKLLQPYVRISRIRYFGFALIPVCLLYSVILRRDYPVQAVGNAGATSMIGRALQGVLAAEQKIGFPLGTSVLAIGTKI